MVLILVIVDVTREFNEVELIVKSGLVLILVIVDVTREYSKIIANYREINMS